MNIIKNEQVIWPHVYELRYHLITGSNKWLRIIFGIFACGYFENNILIFDNFKNSLCIKRKKNNSRELDDKIIN